MTAVIPWLWNPELLVNIQWYVLLAGTLLLSSCGLETASLSSGPALGPNPQIRYERWTARATVGVTRELLIRSYEPVLHRRDSI